MNLRSLVVILLLFSRASWSVDSQFISRFSFLLGMANSTVKSVESGAASRSESPLGFGFAIEHSLTQSYVLIAEHLRSMSGSETAVGFSGIGLKHYPWLNPSHIRSSNTEKLEHTTITHSGYFPYFGATMGFDQASLPSRSGVGAGLAAGVFIDLKAGFDYPMGKTWGARAELNIAMQVFGAGGVQHYDVLGGAYLEL